MSFKKNNYVVVKNAISKDLSYYCFQYLLLKRHVASTLLKNNLISSGKLGALDGMFGTWQDEQVPFTYSNYADIAMEVLLLKMQSLMEKKTKLKLIPNYSYSRIYKKGDVLKRHKDRFSCEISTTLNLGSDKTWPIYLDTTGSNNVIDEHNNIIKSKAPKGIKINLKPGDMLIYKGNLLEHWREPFKGDVCAQVFLHYTNIKTKNAKKNIYDNRLHLGLPVFFKGK